METKLSETRSIIIEGSTAHIVDYSIDPPRHGIKYQFELIDTKVEVIVIHPHLALIKYGSKVSKIVVKGTNIILE